MNPSCLVCESKGAWTVNPLSWMQAWKVRVLMSGILGNSADVCGDSFQGKLININELGKKGR
jgi:hypothetical protein